MIKDVALDGAMADKHDESVCSKITIRYNTMVQIFNKAYNNYFIGLDLYFCQKNLLLHT